MYKIIQKRKLWFSIALALGGLSIIFLSVWGLKLGIDFTGGGLMEVKFTEERPDVVEVQEKLEELELPGGLQIQPTGLDKMILRFPTLENTTHNVIKDKLLTEYGEDNVIEERFEAVGPVIGQELRTKAVYSMIIVLIAIILYIAYAFRHVSRPIRSWKYGIIAIVALIHDILIPLGIFSVLGRFAGIEVGLPFVAALLTILGYSVNDTIVVFDRIRENLARSGESDFEELVNKSVNQTLTRSINTSLTTLIVLLAIFLFGGVTIKFFVLALILGVLSGTYSSIFLASPLLVFWQKLTAKE